MRAQESEIIIHKGEECGEELRETGQLSIGVYNVGKILMESLGESSCIISQEDNKVKIEESDHCNQSDTR